MTTPSGRRRGWRQKEIRQREARRIARYRAGLILESVISNGWSPEDLVKRYGEQGLQEIVNGLEYVAAYLIDTGHPDGTPGPYERRKRS